MYKTVKVGYPGDTSFRPYKLKYHETLSFPGCSTAKGYHYGSSSICVSEADDSGKVKITVSISSPLGHPLEDDVVGNILICLGMDPNHVIDSYPSPLAPFFGWERTQFYTQSLEVEALS